MEVLGPVGNAFRNHIQATDPEAVAEDGFARPGLVRDASEECVRGLTTRRDVIKPLVKANKLLAVAGRQHLRLSFGNNTASEGIKRGQSCLMSVKYTTQTAFVSEIMDPCRHPTQTI